MTALRTVPTPEAIARTLSQGPTGGQTFEEITRCNCHVASLALVRSGLLGEPGPTGWRVARGTTPGVPGQHSWATWGDPYAADAPVVDISAWSYDDTRPQVWVTDRRAGLHTPHGTGSIWASGGPPTCGDGPGVALATWVSAKAREFLRMCAEANDRAHLDIRGWAALANMPVGGWPAREILTAMAATEGLRALIPIDVLGMATDTNPGDLYW